MGEYNIKSAVFYFDAQNTYRQAMKSFDNVTHPNFDPVKLANFICARHFLTIKKIKFYTGVPSIKTNRRWHTFWSQKLGALSRISYVDIYRRETRSRKKQFTINGVSHEINVEVEKGIDVRIAIDIVRDCLKEESDAIVIFSQDQDLSEATNEVKEICNLNKRQVNIYSAFPASYRSENKRGINGTQWVKIEESDYNRCVDPRFYGEKKKKY